MIDEQPVLSLTLPSRLPMLSVARSFVEAACQAGNLDKNTVFAAVMATGEAVTNIVRHAHRDRPEAQMQIQCRLSAGGVEIVLLDEGAPFDLEGVPDLEPGELRLGGRGVYLMRTLMDELSCTPRPSGGNLLRMVKRCRPPAREVG
jgi:serine/threonine-protein kinase RsbW